SPPPGDATNLADALDLSAGLLPSSGRRRIVLLSDGQQNLGRAQDAAARVGRDGIEVDFVRPAGPVVSDVLVRGMQAPAYQREGETLQVTAQVESTQRRSATLRLFIDERLLS